MKLYSVSFFSVIIHPSWGSGVANDYDFALVRLPIPVDFAQHPHIRPACYPTAIPTTGIEVKIFHEITRVPFTHLLFSGHCDRLGQCFKLRWATFYRIERGNFWSKTKFEISIYKVRFCSSHLGQFEYGKPCYLCFKVQFVPRHNYWSNDLRRGRGWHKRRMYSR
jgi:hypothetical protein